MPSPYTWLTLDQATSEVALRLGVSVTDPNAFWVPSEIQLYIFESLRLYNCLTAFWAAPFVIPFTQQPNVNWYPANGSGSPRQQTLTDTDVYKLIECHLMEPVTGSTWTGTVQFSIEDLSQACSRRRN